MNDAFDALAGEIQRRAVAKVTGNRVGKAGRWQAIKASHPKTTAMELGDDSLPDSAG